MKSLVKENVSLQPYNTFGISVFAKKMIEFRSVDELQFGLGNWSQNDETLLILGGGSNVLFTSNIEGLVLKNGIKGFELVGENKEHVWIRAGAGVEWHQFVLDCVAKGYGGIENLSLIPGLVGASPMQNIGAYGVEVKDVISNVKAIEIKSGKIKKFTNGECKFGYRDSIFKQDLRGTHVILNVTFRLTKEHRINTSYAPLRALLQTKNINNPTIKDVSNAVIEIRKSKLPDPNFIGNGGSFFKNPVISREQFEKVKSKFQDVAHYPVDDERIKIAAGWLIEKAGWKGKTYGNYGVHKKQALVLVNYGGANGNEIYKLSSDIIESINEHFEIQLEREVNII